MASPVRVKIATTGAGQARKETGKVSQSLKDMAGSALKWGSVAAGATGALAVSAVKDFAVMDKGIREVATLIPDATQETVDALTSQINDVRTTMGQEGESVTKAFYDGLSAGISPEAIQPFVESAGQLATATGSDIAVAVDLGTTALNAFGLATEEASRINDIMFATVQSGKTTLPELASAYANVAAPANALGVSIEETNAMIAALTLQGVPTAQASTQIKAAFNELADDTKGLGGVFNDVAGQSFKDFIAGGGSVDEALAMIHQHAKDTGQEIINLAGSSEAANAVLLSGGAGADLYAGALENIAGSQGAVEEGFGVMSEGVAFQMQQFTESLAVAKEQLGAFVAPIASEIMPLLLGLMKSLKPIIQSIIAPLGKVIQTVLPIIQKLIDKLAGPFEAVLTAVGDGIVTLVEALGPVLVPIIESLAELFSGVLVEAINIVVPILTELINIIGPVLSDVIQKLVPIVLELVDTLGPILTEILMAVMPIISMLADLLSGVLMDVIEALLPVVNQLIEVLGPIIMEVIGALMPIIQTLADFLGNILGEAIEVLMPVIMELIDILGPIIMDVIQTLMPVIQDLITILADTLLGAIELLLPIIADLVKQLGPPIREVIAILLPILEQLMEAIGPAIQQVLETLLPVIATLLETLGPVIMAVLDALMPVLDTLAELISTVLQVAFDNLLPPILALLDILVKGGSTALTWILENVVVPAINVVSGALETVIGWVSDFIGWIGDMVSTMSNLSFSDIWESIKNGFKAALNFIIGLWNKIDFGFTFTMPDIIGVPGRGQTFGVKDFFPDIPLLAKGGIVTEPTTAIVGEGNADEAVIPLPHNWRREGLGGGITIKNYITVEGSVLTENELLEKIESGLNYDGLINASDRLGFAR